MRAAHPGIGGRTVPRSEHRPSGNRMEPAKRHLLLRRRSRGARPMRPRAFTTDQGRRRTTVGRHLGPARTRHSRHLDAALRLGRRLQDHAFAATCSAHFVIALRAGIQPRHAVHLERPIPPKDHPVPRVVDAAPAATDDRRSRRQEKNCPEYEQSAHRSSPAMQVAAGPISRRMNEAAESKPFWLESAPGQRNRRPRPRARSSNCEDRTNTVVSWIHRLRAPGILGITVTLAADAITSRL